MPTHAEKRILPHSAQHMFDLVADIEKYPEFLPWCTGCRIKNKRGNKLLADMTVGYKLFCETFTSEVTLDHGNMAITVKYLNGPFKHLDNHWQFLAKGKAKCEVDFFIDFEFRNGLLQKAMTVFFSEAVRRMIAAFEARASVVCKGPA